MKKAQRKKSRSKPSFVRVARESEKISYSILGDQGGGGWRMLLEKKRNNTVSVDVKRKEFLKKKKRERDGSK